MGNTSTASRQGTIESMLSKLDVRNSICTVVRDRVEQGTRHTISTEYLEGCLCLVLLGTGPISAIMMAWILSVGAGLPLANASVVQQLIIMLSIVVF